MYHFRSLVAFRKRNLLLWCAALLLNGSPAFAQQGVAVLQGRVLDGASGQPIAGATVTVTSRSMQGKKDIVTDEAGRYRIPQLPPGDYELNVTAPDFKEYTQPAIDMRADAIVAVEVNMVSTQAPDREIEEIVVTGLRTKPDIGSTQSVTNIGAEFIQRIPVALPTGKGAANRSIESVAEIAPQATNDRYGAGISGTTSPENIYIVDGVSVGDPAYRLIGTPLSMEFVSELNIITSGYMPEYGKTTGGVLNAITESGSNEFHGKAWSFVAPGFLEGSRKTVEREAQTVVTLPELGVIYDVGASVGGPIIKDKLWYFVGVDYATTSYNIRRVLRNRVLDDDGSAIVDADGRTVTKYIPYSRQDLVAENNTLQAIAKLTYTLNDNNRFQGTFIASPSWSSGDKNISVSAASFTYDTNLNGELGTQGVSRENSGYDALLKWNWTSDDFDTLVDTSFGYHFQVVNRLPIDGSRIGGSGLAGTPRVRWGTRSIGEFEEYPGLDSICEPVAGVDPCPVTQYASGGPGYIQESTLSRYQLNSVVTQYINDLLGDHTIKAGIDFEATEYNSTAGYSGGHWLQQGGSSYFYERRVYSFLTSPDEVVYLTRLKNTTGSFGIGGFVQDSWNVLDLFTANLGLRYDNQFIIGGQGQVALSMPNQIAPRVGLIWDPTGYSDAKIYANFGIFYHAVPLDLANRSAAGEPSAHGYLLPNTPADGPCDPRATSVANDSCYDRDNLYTRLRNGRSDPNLHYSYGDGLVPIDPDLKPQSSSEVSAGGEYNLFRFLLLGGSYTLRWANDVIEDMSRDEAQTYFIGNPGSGIASDFPKATRTYHAFTLYARKPFGNNWIAQASYTLSFLEGNLAGLFRPETGQLDPNINSDFDLASLLPNRAGPLPGDNRHSFKLFGAYVFDFLESHHLNLGGAFTVRSGAPTSYLGAHELYGNSELFILPRGSGDRLPPIFRFDLNIGYRLDIDEDKSISFTAEVFNLFNFQAATRVDEDYTYQAVAPLEGGTVDDLGKLEYLSGGAFNTADKNPNFGNAITYQDPFTVRLGVRATF